MATLAGQPLYQAAGFQAIEHITESSGGAPVPLVKMGKAVTGPLGLG